ncbi:Eco57I restriction-modification methylase domain-containing protein [Clostridium tepidum]|uniref:site-specific DNA-methyltransferase (adenine-specific) n=1 Tax=Clostridium tepidum TaxID=1962263 RepID=A0ABX3L1Z9_9CLOT|nr:TaqI-like C-terminal specificity domain-containing protein [Clostridium tepidum]OOO61377.1 hypothetical protein BS637_12580 [Clostridium tepidum]
MITENTFDKSKLISELKESHIELVKVYKNIFDYKYHISESFKDFIDKEYKENGISSKERQAWNDNFCHRASYTLLNKILFIRICEDKGFMLNSEDYVAGEPKDPHIGKKLSRIGLQKWANLVTNYTLGELVKLAFLDMKKSYSSISLYKDDKYEMLTPTTEELSLKYLDGDEEAQKLVLQFENALSNIVEKLDTNNYNFNNTDGNILGDVYEKFMDRETRKAIGQFYTPEFVIEYILNNTVAKADVVENPFVSVADISCGSGHFLIMAYDILRERFINNLELLRDKYSNELYTIKKNGKEEELKGRDYWKEENIHYHLLKHCIYGADIDSFAVQLTTINLLLKDLDNFTDELNIVECDSLIKWEEDYDWIDLKQQLEEEFEIVEYNQINLLGEEEKTLVTRKKETYELTYKDIIGIEKTEKISKERAEEIVCLCEFWSEKFDYVVGNPPYIGIKALNNNFKKYFKFNYFVSQKQFDIYAVFYERAILKSNLKVGYITPRPLLNNENLELVRRFIDDNTSINSISDVGMVFDDAGVETSILILGKKSNRTNEVIINKFNSINSKIEIVNVVKQCIFKELPFSIFNIYMNEKNYRIYSKIIKNADYKLGHILDITRGIEMGKNDETIINNYEGDKELIFGEDLQRYKVNIYKRGVIFDYNNTTKFKEDNLYKGKRLLIRRVADRLICTPIEQELYALNTIYIGKLNIDYSIYLLSSLINSKLINYWFKLTFMNDDKLFPYIRTSQLKLLPIKLIKENDVINEMNIRQIIDLNTENNIDYKDINFEHFIDQENKLLDKAINKDNILAYIEKEICRIYGIDDYDIEVINSADFFEEKIIFNRDKVSIDKLEKRLPPNQFEIEHIKNNKSIFDLADEYNLTVKEIALLRKYYAEKYYAEEPWRFYNLTKLNEKIYTYISNRLFYIIKNRNRYIEVDELSNVLRDKEKNFGDIIKIVKQDDVVKSTDKIIKEAMESYNYTWNSYRKAKKNNKVNKTFIKYYDSKFYGLAEWSDEIHKNYFLDAIEEYTVNNPNEKKSKDILKLFKDLDIEDKQDYIEVIEEKIRKAFK